MEDEELLKQEIDREYEDELKKEEDIIEALLFTLGRSVSVDEIAAALKSGNKPAEKAMGRLIERYEKRKGGILIRCLEDRYEMYTNPDCFDALIRVVKRKRKPVLTDVVIETLAIIAYKQPVTKAEIEKIRGVKSDHAVNRLIEYELVRESGRLNAPGHPSLFVTTEEFLRHFGISTLKDLPALDNDVNKTIAEEAETEIAEIMGNIKGEEDVSGLDNADKVSFQ